MRILGILSGFISIAALSLSVTGCADLTPTQQRAATGALAGSAGGAVIGAIAGNAGMGAAIGGATGALGGFAFGRHQEAVNRAYQQGRQSATQGN